MNIELNEIICLFKNKISKNATLSNSLKYPYKPFLIVALFHNLEVEELFNNEIILLDKTQVIKTYYNLLTSNFEIFDILRKQKEKANWIELGFNELLKNHLITNIFNNPVEKLKLKNSDFWEFNKKNKSIKINIKSSSKVYLQNIKDEILNHAFNVIRKCIPSYATLSDNEIMYYDSFIEQEILSHINLVQVNESRKRKYQHIFRKKVLDRDKKCLICCEEFPDMLDAAHIKPDSCCNVNSIERYDENNGITLCANHHRLFDKNNFTFNPDWTIKILNNFQQTDAYLKFKQYEPCYNEIPKNKSSLAASKYLEFRNKWYLSF